MKDYLSKEEFNKLFKDLNKEEKLVIIKMLEEIEDVNKRLMLNKINKYINKYKGCSI